MSEEKDYDNLLIEVQNSFEQFGGERLFETQTMGLFQIFLDRLPNNRRQHYTCHSCRRFFERYAGLVRVDGRGELKSVLWEGVAAKGFFKAAIDEVREQVEAAGVRDVFVKPKGVRMVLGEPRTGIWSHLAVTRNTMGDSPAGITEAVKDVKRALSEWSTPVIDLAVSYLQTEGLLERSEKVLAAVEWFQKVKHARREALVFKEVAEAPEGFLHPRSSMLGTLLDDISKGLSLNDIKNKFGAKMKPTAYQRPTAAPTEGQIKEAERLVGQLEVKDSLRRRFARPDELDYLWKPDYAAQRTGVFAGLYPKAITPSVGMGKITWCKFRDQVLTQQELRVWVPKSGCFLTFTEAAVEGSQPLFQWGSTLAWYVYENGSEATRYGLKEGWTPLAGIAEMPCKGIERFGEKVVLVLAGKDRQNQALGLFPETLRSEFHPIRGTIEAFSKGNKLEEIDGPAGMGLCLQKGQSWNVQIAVGERVYTLDRWD